MYVDYKNFRDYYMVLHKHWRMAVAVGGGIFALVLLATFLATPMYEGSVQIIIERVETDNLTGSSKVQPPDPEFDKTQFQLIRSHAVARRVVEQLDLKDGTGKYEKPTGSNWFGAVGQAAIRGFSWLSEMVRGGDKAEVAVDTPNTWTTKDQVAMQIAKNVRVRPVQGSHITAISYMSPNPEFAALAANTFVRAYLDETLDMKMEATRRNLEWMTRKAEDERLRLQATERKLQSYMENHNLVSMEDRVTIVPEALTQLGRDLIGAESRTKEYKLLYDKVRGVSEDLDAAENVLAVSEGGVLDVLRAQILRAEQVNMELSSKYGAKHPMMLKATADLEILREKRRQEVNRLIAKIKNQYELALSNENSIRAQLHQTKAEALGLNEKYVEYSEIKREIDANRQFYDALMTKIKDKTITAETWPVNISILENAKVPKQPASPVVPLNLLLGLVLGLCGGVGSALIVDRMDNCIKTSESLPEILGVPSLGSVTCNRDPARMGEIVRTAPRSEYAESYNALRTTLLLSSADKPPRHILISSSIAGEGKTTTAVNLALTMAKSGSKVLLVDADLRKPSLHKIFKLHNEVGLSGYLAGGSGKSILNKGPHENLTLILAGSLPANPYELLNSSRMELLLTNLGQEYDVIICDTPPILSVADALVLNRFFDGMILVVRAGLTTYPMAKKTLRMAREVKATVMGVFVNAVHIHDQEYYAYHANYIDSTAKPAKVDIRPILESAGSREK